MQPDPASSAASPTSPDPAEISLRLDLAAGKRLGPGKIRLLEAIRAQGSIAKAGREFGMSYRRAWLLVDELNAMFSAPLVETRGGGRGGGGAALTALGETVVALYREAERKAKASAAVELDALRAALAPAVLTAPAPAPTRS